MGSSMNGRVGLGNLHIQTHSNVVLLKLGIGCHNRSLGRPVVGSGRYRAVDSGPDCTVCVDHEEACSRTHHDCPLGAVVFLTWK